MFSVFFFFSSRRRHTRCLSDWSSDVCSSDLDQGEAMGRLDGKCVLVTGASRGIGAEIARLFAGEGGRVVCAARTLREGEHLVARAREIYGPVDVLVNNAALTYYVQVKDYPINKWMRSWAVNFHAPFMLSQLVLGDMIARRRGAIVNISSGSAIGPGRGPYPDPATGARGGTCYGAEKAALERFTQGLASEVYQYGIAVSSVAPSQVVPTPGTVYHKLVKDMEDPRGEPPILMARASLLLVSEPLDKITGRVTYSQPLLREFGWITEARGRGADSRGSGYSEI